MKQPLRPVAGEWAGLKLVSETVGANMGIELVFV